MSIRVERTDRFGERFSLRTQDLLGAESLIDTLTRDEAQQLRDDLTVALRANRPPSSTYLLACRLNDEARAMGDAAA
jgi:hypothetical protein